ncbi:monovalent cation/H+ antiporter complex subunit F [Thiorhodococcus fuscus]|uniref:Monovalent cation/H+ antiporter complex subunit F n=1 Tax=Thiorhodococcus fuscus TaxID=527200 RepID=A0ABW4Y2Z8_9GAMM
MSDFFVAIALVLLLSMTAGLVRVVVGPTPADRMMGAQLLGTTGIAVLLLLGRAFAMPALADVALIFALLAAVAVSAFTRRRLDREPDA